MNPNEAPLSRTEKEKHHYDENLNRAAVMSRKQTVHPPSSPFSQSFFACHQPLQTILLGYFELTEVLEEEQTTRSSVDISLPP